MKKIFVLWLLLASVLSYGQSLPDINAKPTKLPGYSMSRINPFSFSFQVKPGYFIEGPVVAEVFTTNESLLIDSLSIDVSVHSNYVTVAFTKQQIASLPALSRCYISWGSSIDERVRRLVADLKPGVGGGTPTIGKVSVEIIEVQIVGDSYNSMIAADRSAAARDTAITKSTDAKVFSDSAKASRDVANAKSILATQQALISTTSADSALARRNQSLTFRNQAITARDNAQHYANQADSLTGVTHILKDSALLAKVQAEAAAVNASIYVDGIEVAGGYNAATNSPALTSNSSGYGEKSFFRVFNSGISVFAFTNFPSGTTISDGDKIRKNVTGWYLEKYTAKQDITAFWVGTSPIIFDFTAKTITLAINGFWVKGNNYYNNNLALSGIPPGSAKVINMPASLSGINYFFADFTTATYYCVNYPNRATVPATATLIATWFDADGKELTYAPAIFAKKGSSLSAYGITNAYTKSEVYSKTETDNRDRWLTWKYTSDVVFDFTAKTITIPPGYWLLDKTYYNNQLFANTSQAGTSTIVVNMSTANSGGAGINYLFADLAGRQYYALNQTELATSTPPAGSVLIARWFNASGDYLEFSGRKSSVNTVGGIQIASEAERLAGTNSSKAVTPALLAKSSQTSRVFWIGPSPLNFDFTAQTITVPVSGFWSKGNDYYNCNLVISSGASGADKVVNMPGSGAASAGINYFFADFTTATYYCVNYPNRATVPATATLIATWFNATGAELNYFTPSLFAKKSTNIAGYGITDAYTKTEVDARVSAFSESNMRLISASKLFLIDGVTLPIYKSSITPVSSGLNSFKFALIEKDNSNHNVPRYRYAHEDITIDASALKPDVALGMAQTGSLKTYIQPLTITHISQASVTGKTGKVLMIGNSLTNRNLPAEVKTFFAKYGGIATMVGTMANTGGQSGEGREGWEFENYIGKDNNHSAGGTVIVPDYSNPSGLFKNPFLKLATTQDKTDHPDWCFRNTGSSDELSYTSDPVKTGDFYIFDFANYISQTGVNVPDVITLELGTNDILQDGITDATIQSLFALEVMITQIKAAYPSMKIGIVPGTVRGVTSIGNTGWADTCVLIENIMQKVKTLSVTYSNLSVIPVWMHQNRDFNFPVTTTALSATNDTQVSTVSDQVHWNDEGRMEYAIVVASFLANIL